MKRIVSILIVLVMVFTPATVIASTIDATLQTVTNSALLSSLCTEANAKVPSSYGKVLTYDAANGLLKFSNKTYQKLTADQKEEFMETALKYVSNFGGSASAQMKNSVYNFIAQQDKAVTSAMKYLQVNSGTDLAEAEKWFRPFSGPIGTFLGIVCIFIFLFLGFSIIFDICYLVLPMFQSVLDASSDGKKRPWGVSREAYGSLKDAEKSDEYKNVMSLYFKRRAGVMIIVAVAITYMISGKIYDLIIWFVESFSF